MARARIWAKRLGIAWMGVLVVAVTMPMTDWIVLPPRWSSLPVPAGQTRIIVPMDDGGQLDILERKNAAALAGQRPVLRVLSFCGQGDQAQKKGWDMLDLVDSPAGSKSIVFWTMNYPGYGETTGPSRLARIGPCTLAAFDALKAADPHCPIVISGHSLGTVAALHLAARRNVDAVVIKNPPWLRPMFMRQGWWNLWTLAVPLARRLPDDLDSVANAAAARAPALLIISTGDEVVPFALQRAVADAYQGPHEIIEGSGGHDDFDAVTVSPRVQELVAPLLHRITGHRVRNCNRRPKAGRTSRQRAGQSLGEPRNPSHRGRSPRP